MEIKNSVVKSITNPDQFTTQHGTFYGYWIDFENGDRGLYNSKSESQNKFIVGQAADYEAMTMNGKKGQYLKVKPHNPEYAGRSNTSTGGGASSYKPMSDDRQKSIVRQSTLKAAVEFLGNHYKDGQHKPADVIKIAEVFEAWVHSSTPEAKPDQFTEPQKEAMQSAEQSKKVAATTAPNDLPF